MNVEGSVATSPLTWDVYVAPPEPTLDDDPPPGANVGSWSPISATLISGDRDAVPAVIEQMRRGSTPELLTSFWNARITEPRPRPDSSTTRSLPCTPTASTPARQSAFFRSSAKTG
jgi:hypothetical protein